MKPYRILKTFKGSQTGNDGPFHFEAGTTAMLSDHLAEVVLKAGWVELVAGQVTNQSAPLLARMRNQEDSPEVPNPDEIQARETKVEEVAETKPAPAAKKKKKVA